MKSTTSSDPGNTDACATIAQAHSIVLDFERGKTSGLRDELWQTDTSVSWRDWSYMRSDAFKTVDELVRELIDIVSKNGVLLLDVGPRPDGSIPPEPQAILRGIGAWLRINGEAIYGTRPCWALGFGEGPHNSGGGGFSDRQVDYTHRDFRFTQKGNVLYAIAMDWPDVDDHFVVTSLGDRPTLSTDGISTVSLLGAKEPIEWKRTPEGLWIRRPDVRPCDGAYVFKIDLHGMAIEKLAARRINDKQMRVKLRVRNLDLEPAQQQVTILDNGRVVGSGTFALKPSETVSREMLLEAPQRDALETITASMPDGKPFIFHDQILSPPSFAAAHHFDGTGKLAVSKTSSPKWFGRRSKTAPVARQMIGVNCSATKRRVPWRRRTSTTPSRCSVPARCMWSSLTRSRARRKRWHRGATTWSTCEPRIWSCRRLSASCGSGWRTNSSGWPSTRRSSAT
jgi:hypothetical protein